MLTSTEAGSIRAASRELNVASSAINRQVLWLEEALGLQLFDRVGRRLRLSQAGELLLAHIRRTYSDFEGTVAELDALKGLRRGTVSIASVESVAEKLLPAVISTFRKSYPGIHVNVSISSSREAARKVELDDIQTELAETHELLGKLHNQKVFWRPSGDKPYVGG